MMNFIYFTGLYLIIVKFISLWINKILVFVKSNILFIHISNLNLQRYTQIKRKKVDNVYKLIFMICVKVK